MRPWIVLTGLFALSIAAALFARPADRPVDGARFEPEDTIPGPVEPSDWFYRQRAFPAGRIDQAAFVRAQRQSAAMKAGGPTWTFAGPTNVGGRVTSLAVESFDVFYAGTGSGGLFKTTDGGQTYAPVGDGAFSLSIGDVALDPEDAQTVWVGTGEANGGGGSLTYGGSGVYRSRDGGATWQARGLEATGTIGRIVVDPTDGDRVWVAAAGTLFDTDPSRGVFRTTDGGDSWTRTLAVDDSTGAIDLAVNPRAPDTLYAATWTRQRRPDDRSYGGPGSGVWRSADGGASWTQLANGLPSGSLGRIGLAVAASRPNVVYAVVTDVMGSTIGTYRTTDGGDSWTSLPGADTVSFGWWFGQIRVDPTDWRRVWTPWLDLYRSTTAGGSWQYQSGSMHVDHHALWIDPKDPSRMIAGNDGGVYRTTSGTSASVAWTKSPGGFPATQFYTVEMDASAPERLYGGTQDNGTNRTLTGALDDWTRIFGGDGHYVLVDPTNNQYVYASYQYGNLFRSSNGGLSFSSARPPGVARANWSAPVAFDPADPATLYYGGARVWKSTNRGVSWTAISPDLTGGPGAGSLVYGTLTTIGVSDSGRLWAGTDDGRVWTSATGASWTDVSAGLPERWVTRVTPHPTDPYGAVATLSGFRWGEAAALVYATDDGGATWTPIGGALPDAPANDVLFDAADPDRLFLATDVGMFWSADAGATWQGLGSGLPMVPVTDLDIEGRSLVAATYGRGLYRLDLDAITTSTEGAPAAPSVRLAVAPNPARAATDLTVTLPAPAVGSVRVFDLRGREALTLPMRALPAGESAVRLDLSALAPGAYLVRLDTPTGAASARLAVVR
ncbi:MAG TPA: T9SS type A sorting domain-containing protein [Bacteroidetes bacterium]|nr:T9SS type A sorting domain-containing protein [Bacteroidota bacterium]HIL58817.1 T9SS type A sorting domain-containing protein [Rhodothermales bacterium]